MTCQSSCIPFSVGIWREPRVSLLWRCCGGPSPQIGMIMSSCHTLRSSQKRVRHQPLFSLFPSRPPCFISIFWSLQFPACSTPVSAPIIAARRKTIYPLTPYGENSNLSSLTTSLINVIPLPQPPFHHPRPSRRNFQLHEFSYGTSPRSVELCWVFSAGQYLSSVLSPQSPLTTSVASGNGSSNLSFLTGVETTPVCNQHQLVGMTHVVLPSNWNQHAYNPLATLALTWRTHAIVSTLERCACEW